MVLQGAIAFMFFIVAVGGLTTFSSLAEQIRIIAVSVISGFGARSLLPRMVGHLEKQIVQAEAKAESANTKAENATVEAELAMKDALEARKSAEELRKETDKKIEASSVKTILIHAAHPQTPEAEWKEALARAQSAIKDGATDPGIRINAARVLRWHGEINDAINSLDDAIAAFDSDTDKIRRRQSQCFAYFNRACYYASRYVEKGDAADLESAFEDIKNCLRIADRPAEWLASMRGDKELSSVVSLPKFEKIADEFMRST